MTQVFFDDFEDGNSTTPSWIDGDPTQGGVWSVATREAGNHVFAQTAPASDWVIAVSGDYRWTDQTVEAVAKRTSSAGMIGVFGRMLDLRNYYFLYLDGSNVILRKKVDASSTNLVKIKFAMVSGTAYTLRLSIVGTTLTGYVDGVMLVTASDTSVTTGGIGVGTSDSGVGEFDNVRVSR
jgi:pectate lyase